MQTENQPDKKGASFFVKLLVFLFCLAGGVIIARYKGVGNGLILGTVAWIFLYRNILRYQPKTKEDLAYEQMLLEDTALFKPYTKKLLIFFIIVVSANIFLFVLTRNLGAPVFLDMFSIIAVIFFFVSVKKASKNDARTQLAREKGFSFAVSGDSSSLPEQLQALGKNLKLSNVFSGTLTSYPVRIFDFDYEWMREASYSATMLEVTCLKQCPKMLIISSNDAFGETFKVPTLFPGLSVQLEGDFSKSFSLFVEAGAEDEIRQFLPPDIMAILMDTMPEFSFMFLDNKIYFVLSNNSERSFSKAYFLAQLAKAELILAKWELTLSRMEF